MTLKKIATRIANKILRRKCRDCWYWFDYRRFGEGCCHREIFVSLNEQYGWFAACERFEKKEGCDHA